MNETILHSVIVIVGIVAYAVLSATGHDGNAVLTAVLGYAGGAGVSKASSIAKT